VEAIRAGLSQVGFQALHDSIMYGDSRLPEIKAHRCPHVDKCNITTMYRGQMVDLHYGISFRADVFEVSLSAKDACTGERHRCGKAGQWNSAFAGGFKDDIYSLEPVAVIQPHRTDWRPLRPCIISRCCRFACRSGRSGHVHSRPYFIIHFTPVAR
jgi:hypothetical protein